MNPITSFYCLLYTYALGSITLSFYCVCEIALVLDKLVLCLQTRLVLASSLGHFSKYLSNIISCLHILFYCLKHLIIFLQVEILWL